MILFVLLQTETVHLPDLEFLRLPAWLITLAIVFIAGVRGALWIKSARNGHDTPSTPTPNPEFTERRLEAQVESREALKSIGTQMTTIGTVLNSTALTLVKVAERLDHLPNKEDLSEATRDIRHKVDSLMTALLADSKDHEIHVLDHLDLGVKEITGDLRIHIGQVLDRQEQDVRDLHLAVDSSRAAVVSEILGGVRPIVMPTPRTRRKR